MFQAHWGPLKVSSLSESHGFTEPVLQSKSRLHLAPWAGPGGELTNVLATNRNDNNAGDDDDDDDDDESSSSSSSSY